MNKNWFTLLILGLITLVIYVGYTFYVSISGGNATFGKTVSSIESDLGKSVLDALKVLDKNVPIRDEGLDDK